MEHQETLTKAIQKAIDNGWKLPMWVKPFIKRTGKAAIPIDEGHIPAIIFNHDFAKALWGEEELTLPNNKYGSFDNGGMRVFAIYKNKGWKNHLKEMVIADDPIKYLGEHL